MAATIATAVGFDSSRVKEVHRLGSERAAVTAATWRTFVDATVWRDGSGRITVKRDGTVIHEFIFDAENVDIVEEE